MNRRLVNWIAGACLTILLNPADQRLVITNQGVNVHDASMTMPSNP